MRKESKGCLYSIVLFILLSLFVFAGSKAQTIEKDSQGNYISSSKKDTSAISIGTPIDKTYTDAKGIKYPLYKSKSGSVYAVITSKNGKVYKKYMPK